MGDAVSTPQTDPVQGVGAPEITPAMLKAGADMIADEWGICGADIAPDLARDVFIAMWAQKDLGPNLSSS
jgi:hypothetical protein